MKPNYEKMSKAELTAYILANREDDEALRVLFSRRTPDSEATWYGPLVTSEGLPIEETALHLLPPWGHRHKDHDG